MPKKPLSEEDIRLFRQKMNELSVLALKEEKRVIKNERSVLNVLPRPIKNNEFVPPLVQDYISNQLKETVDAETILSFQRVGLASKQFNALKMNRLKWEERLDLHGFVLQEASELLLAFIKQQALLGHRCVLIIHGKGGRYGENPVLKNHVYHWLPQLSQVLAFHSALPRDGGSGALYVLLRGFKP